MARKEFTAAVKRAAWARCGGRCEGTLSTGIRCNAVLNGKRKDFDHINPDGLTGQPTLENCAVLCELCHLEKTAKVDIPAIARAKRRSDAHLGISASSKPLQSGQSLTSQSS